MHLAYPYFSDEDQERLKDVRSLELANWLPMPRQNAEIVNTLTQSGDVSVKSLLGDNAKMTYEDGAAFYKSEGGTSKRYALVIDATGQPADIMSDPSELATSLRDQDIIEQSKETGGLVRSHSNRAISRKTVDTDQKQEPHGVYVAGTPAGEYKQAGKANIFRLDIWSLSSCRKRIGGNSRRDEGGVRHDREPATWGFEAAGGAIQDGMIAGHGAVHHVHRNYDERLSHTSNPETFNDLFETGSWGGTEVTAKFHDLLDSLADEPDILLSMFREQDKDGNTLLHHLGRTNDFDAWEKLVRIFEGHRLPTTSTNPLDNGLLLGLRIANNKRQEPLHLASARTQNRLLAHIRETLNVPNSFIVKRSSNVVARQFQFRPTVSDSIPNV